MKRDTCRLQDKGDFHDPHELGIVSRAAGIHYDRFVEYQTTGVPKEERTMILSAFGFTLMYLKTESAAFSTPCSGLCQPSDRFMILPMYVAKTQ